MGIRRARVHSAVSDAAAVSDRLPPPELIGSYALPSWLHLLEQQVLARQSFRTPPWAPPPSAAPPVPGERDITEALDLALMRSDGCGRRRRYRR